MLRRLLIRDYVIVEELELEFGSGFGALTGETGAGKSILVDALSLVLGARGDGAIVRPGCGRAEVVAEFDVGGNDPAAAWLENNDFVAEDGSLLLRRVIDGGGRSRAYINGAAATVAQLREAGEFLADIHGQHLHHSLVRTESQRAILDAQAGLAALARRVADSHSHWRQLAAAREEAERNSAAGAREREILAWQLGELQRLGVDAAGWLEDWQQANQEQSRLAHAASLREGCAAALLVLDEGGEGSYALGVAIDGVIARLRPLGAYDETLAAPLALLEEAQVQIAEASHCLRRYRDGLDEEPQRLSELESQIAAAVSAARKHRVVPEELPAVFSALRERLDQLDLAADLPAMAAREAAAMDSYQKLAAELSAGRKAAAGALAAAITAAMQQLGMPGGHFEIELSKLAQGAAHGLENVVFLVATNAGQPPRPLARVASGGELSRIGLAIQVIASAASGVATLIFDEIDVGIGGRVAEIVGRMLHELGSRRQVLCVTHLPQVAACADWQWSVAKEEVAGIARSRVTSLDGQARVDELARMLGGVTITPATRRHAAELLAGSKAG